MELTREEKISNLTNSLGVIWDIIKGIAIAIWKVKVRVPVILILLVVYITVSPERYNNLWLKHRQYVVKQTETNPIAKWWNGLGE